MFSVFRAFFTVSVIIGLRQLLDILPGTHGHLADVADLRGDDCQLELDIPLRLKGFVVRLADSLLSSEWVQPNRRFVNRFALFFLGLIRIPLRAAGPLLSDLANFGFKVLTAERAFLLLAEPSTDAFLMEAVLGSVIVAAVEHFKCLAFLELD